MFCYKKITFLGHVVSNEGTKLNLGLMQHYIFQNQRQLPAAGLS